MKQIVWTILIITTTAFTCLIGYGSYKVINSSAAKGVCSALIKEKTQVSVKDTTFTIQKFCLELQTQGILYSDIVLKQACLESGYFTSKIWKKYNNPFGFRFKGSYLQFDDYKDAIRYYKLWQTKNFPMDGELVDKELYYQFLENINYAEDTLYIEKLKNINIDKLK